MTHTIIISDDITGYRRMDWIVCDASVPFVDVVQAARIVRDMDGWNVVGIRNDATGKVFTL